MNTYLTIIQYDSPADQVFLVQNTAAIYGYFEDAVTGSNAMIALVTDSQRQTLSSKGYIIQTIEQNPNMENYTLLYNASPSKGHLLSEFGDIYMVTENHTLLRLHNGVPYEANSRSSQFSEMPLENLHTQIAKKNEIQKQPQADSNYFDEEKKQTDVITVTPVPKPLQYMGSYLIIAGIVLAALLVLFIYLYLKKTKALKT